MVSRSAQVSTERPFYDLHADAYDALIVDPVEPWVDAVDGQLRSIGLPRASILDAGCGTGRHAAALIARGHRVTLLDASPALLGIARERCPGATARTADVCAPQTGGPFDAVICRGVLNDLTSDGERAAAISSFADLVSPAGLVILDVRERRASKARADGSWRKTEADLADGTHLTFESRPTWTQGHIVVDERYELVNAAGTVQSAREYTFQMRPWTHDELNSGLAAAGFVDIDIQAGVGRRTNDRLFVTARR